MNQWDAIVIGGGPAGSTAAHILAKAGKSVLLIEGETFPRFHIGESLLPASTPIFKRLGLLERMQENFILKPGGKWFVGPGRWRGQFAECDPSACFAEEPYAFMVERSLFDKILLERAREVGVRILSPARVLQPLMDGERVTGLRVRHPDGQTVDYRCPIVFDCSGRATFLARKFGLLSPTTLNRMALYSYYRATPQDPDLQDGWFVGQMIADGWTWAIPLKDGRISVGVVFNQDQLAADRDPDDFYEASLRASGFLERVFKAGFRRVDEIKRTANIGYSSRKLYGPGWVLAGDAGFFVDPCFSSGVHLALHTAVTAADGYLQAAGDERLLSEFLANYERSIRAHEESVTLMVKHFYNVSRFPRVQKLTGVREDWGKQIQFNTFIGGDFSLNPDFPKNTYAGVARLMENPL